LILYCKSPSTVSKILLEGLDTAALFSLKYLRIQHCRGTPPPSMYDRLTNILDLDLCCCDEELFLPLLSTLDEGGSQRLHTLKLSMSGVQTEHACKLLQMISDGKLPSIKDLDLEGNQFSRAGKARLQMAAKKYPGLWLETGRDSLSG
jgi:hypothetical protein